MKLLTKETDYAVRALVYLVANRDRFVSSREISKAEEIPLPYLRRILQKLREEKVIRTREGVGGGCRAEERARKITVPELIKIFQGKVRLIDCMFRKQLCRNRKTCPLRKRVKAIEKEVISGLDKITIGSLVGDKEESGE